MIMRILHGHSACTVNSLVLSQSLTWWIKKNQHSNGHLCHSFEQNILEDIQQTQVNIKHRAYLQNHFLGEPTVDPPNLFTGDFFFLAGESPFLPIQSARLWMMATAISWCLSFGSFSPSISPFFSMISSVLGWFSSSKIGLSHHRGPWCLDHWHRHGFEQRRSRERRGRGHCAASPRAGGDGGGEGVA